MAIQKCAGIEFGYDKDCPSGNFGLKDKGVSGRNGQTAQAVLIRCIPEGYGMPCYVDGNLKKEADSFRESYHYVVRASGEVIRDVPENATSWGLKPRLVKDESQLPNVVYNVEYPECEDLDWNPINTIPANAYKDDLLIIIGIEVPKTGNRYPLTWGHKQCLCTSEGGCGATLYQNFNNQQLYKLARLLKWISTEHPTLTLDNLHYQFYQNINDCCSEECGCQPSIEEMICLSTNFCEPIKNMAGSFVAEGQVSYIYGFNSDGIPVKEDISSALLRLVFQSATDEDVYIKNAAGNYVLRTPKP